jgi:hypothetical protein
MHCIAIRMKDGTIGWAYKSRYVGLPQEKKAQIAQTALFSVKEGQSEDGIQFLAEQAIATENERWSGVQVPDEDS